jgi:drug/metabolite transporter (DMT)-like permease
MVYFSLIFQSLIASGTHLVAKVVVKDIEPVALTMIRSTLAAVGLILIMLVRRGGTPIAREDYGRLLLLSFLAIPANQFLFLTALRHTTASNASLMYAATPAVVLVISSVTGKEMLTLRKMLGVSVAFGGILLVVFEHGIDISSDYTFGNLLLVAAVISWAFYTVKGRPMIMKYGAFRTSALTMILGAMLYLPVGAVNAVEFDYSRLTPAHWVGLAYLSLGTSIFAYFLWYYALGRIEASKVAIFSNLQPVMTTLLAFFLLSQPISLTFIAGGAITLAGIVLTQFG